MKNIMKFWNKFTDDEELIKFKITCVTIIIAIGQVIL